MLFNSIDFLIFFPIVTLLYFLIPYRFRYIWLLLASYYFYMAWNPVYALLKFYQIKKAVGSIKFNSKPFHTIFL